MFGDMEMWIDKETWMPLKMDVKDADGNPMYSVEYRNFQLIPAYRKCPADTLGVT
jgi:outer membrane lipoprotein-sorting protein